MASRTYKSEEFPVAMLLVALDTSTQQQIMHAAGQKHWSVTFFEQEEYPSAARRPSFRSQLSAGTFCAAFIDFDGSAEEACKASRFLQETSPEGIALIAVASEPEPELILSAMRSGCTEFLHKTQAIEDLPDLMDRLETLSIQTERQVAAPGVVLSLMGVKGGVGTTTLAVELASVVRKTFGKRTLLVDAHTDLGHAGIYLGLDAVGSYFSDVVSNVNRLDSELLRGFVAQHSSGLDVLCSPDKSQDRAPWSQSAVERTIAFLRSEYEYIIVDCPIDDPEVTPALVGSSLQVYLVSAPEIGAIRDLSRQVDRLSLLDGAADKLKVVLNRSVAQFVINAEQIERAIKLPIAIKVPNKYAELVKAQNLGEPVAVSRDADIGNPVKAWASSIVGVAAPVAAPPKKKLLSWFSQDLQSNAASAREA